MISHKKKTIIEYFDKGKRVVPDGNSNFSMSYDQFEKMHQNFHFPIQLYPMFNEIFESVVVSKKERAFLSSYFHILYSKLGKNWSICLSR